MEGGRFQNCGFRFISAFNTWQQFQSASLALAPRAFVSSVHSSFKAPDGCRFRNGISARCRTARAQLPR
eukprot:3010662-Pyramimonas_sp.AAC.1